MKKIRLLLIALFAFVTLSSFTEGTVKESLSEDSVRQTVLVQFDNPRILIDDYREYQGWAEVMKTYRSKDSTLNETIQGLNTIFGSYVISQERRYESSMAYLTRKTGFTIDEIYNAYEKKRRTDVGLAMSSILLLFLAFFIAYSGEKSMKGGWLRQACWFVILSSLFGAILYLINWLLLITINQPYHYINEILKLSG